MKKVFLCFFIFGFFLIKPLAVIGKEYDFYVDFSIKESGDGSKKEPFQEIGEAIAEAKDKKKQASIYIKEGKYKESFTIGKAISLIGEERDEVIIMGDIIMSDETLLKNLTISNSNTAVTIREEANATIENCTINNFVSIGINSLPGGGTLSVSGSKISEGGGKGLYIQRGKRIEIISNQVSENEEEGVDIRSKVIGNVNSNNITDNGESGIEVIVGSSHLDIEDNKIKDNGSSGIATQFYKDFDKEGNIDVYNNKISNNKKYGFDCNRPHGGSGGSSYWRDSIEMKGNEIKSNKEGSISSVCKFMEAVDEEEEKDNTIDETGYNEEENTNQQTVEEENKELTRQQQELEAAKQKEREEEQERQRQQKLEKLDEIKDLLEESQKISQEVETGIERIRNQSALEDFVFGVNRVKADKLIKKSDQNTKKVLQANGIATQINLEPKEETMLNEIILSKHKTIEEQKTFLEQKKASMSLAKWLKQYWMLVFGLIISVTFLVFSLRYYLKKRNRSI
ncbi:MAG: hypothetical protein GF335_03445 [Candidatus Moranbacteria bacterium]|nr:hypothetical protein [Candidatus Moranbacteria bacterium]